MKITSILCADKAFHTGDGKTTIEGAGVSNVNVSDFPHMIRLALFVQCESEVNDSFGSWKVKVKMVDEDRIVGTSELPFQTSEEQRTARIIFELNFQVIKEGPIRFDVSIADTSALGSWPLMILKIP